MFSLYKTIPKSKLLHIIARNYDTAYRVNKNGNLSNVLQKAKYAGIKLDHPLVGDPAKLNPDGTLNVKAQVTHGKGHPSNPSKVLNPVMDLSGKSKQQNVISPLQSFQIGPKSLTSIVNSEKYLDDKVVKDNMNSAGIEPSNYMSGAPYVPPGALITLKQVAALNFVKQKLQELNKEENVILLGKSATIGGEVFSQKFHEFISTSQLLIDSWWLSCNKSKLRDENSEIADRTSYEDYLDKIKATKIAQILLCDSRLQVDPLKSIKIYKEFLFSSLEQDLTKATKGLLMKRYNNDFITVMGADELLRKSQTTTEVRRGKEKQLSIEEKYKEWLIINNKIDLESITINTTEEKTVMSEDSTGLTTYEYNDTTTSEQTTSIGTQIIKAL